MRIRLALSLTFLIAGPAVAQVDRYDLVPIGTLPNSSGYSRAYQVNDLIETACFAQNAAGLTEAALWLPRANYGMPAGLNGLGLLPGGTFSKVLSVNNHGEALGYADDAAGNTVIVIWLPRGRLGYQAGWNVVDPLGGDEAYARYGLQDDLTFVCYGNRVAGGPMRARLHLAVAKWGFPAGVHDLGPSSTTLPYSELLNVNSIGTATGSISTMGEAEAVPAVWDPSRTGSWNRISAANMLGRALAVNERGIVVGDERTSGGFRTGFRIEFFFRTRLDPAPGGTDAYPRDINERNTTIGSTYTRDSNGTVVREQLTRWVGGLRSVEGVDVNGLVPAAGPGGWNLRRAFGIHDNGLIGGYGDDPAGVERGFLLIPDTFVASASPSSAARGEFVRFDVGAAAPNRDVAIMAIGLNGQPVSALLEVGTTDGFGGAQIWMGFPIPAGLAGIRLTLQAVSYDLLDRKLIRSAPFELRFI